MRICVLTGDHRAPDATKPGGHYNPEDLEADRRMREAFAQYGGGHAFEFLNDHSVLLERMRTHPPDLVVNFCDTGYMNRASQELNVPALLEILDVPYTGAPPAAMAVCYDKEIVRFVAQGLGVPVPREHFIPPGQPADRLPDLYPALIKPNQADGSLGITADAVVRDPAEARAYVERTREALPGRALLMQEYLPGPEYGVGLIGNPDLELEALPVLEVDFSGLPAGLNPILGYESKTVPDSPYWTDIRFIPARAPEDTTAAMADAAKGLFARLGLRDYGRFDFRAAADGTPRLMEVNPNPAWGYDGKLALMAGFAGMSYPRLLGRIVETALGRIGR